MLIYYKSHADFPRRIVTGLKVKPIIEALDIYCFDYSGFKKEYRKFTSKDKLDPQKRDPYQSVYHDNLCYYLMSDKEIESPYRSHHAKSYGIVKFCIALELRCILTRVEGRDNPIYFEKKHTLRILDFASKFYNRDFINYISSYSMLYARNSHFYKHEDNPALDSFLDYIHDCFFNRQEPFYTEYLKYSSNYDFIKNKEEIQYNFKKLLYDTEHHHSCYFLY